MSPSPPPPLDAAKLVGLLADEDRRRVVAALILGAVDAESVQSLADLGAAPAGKALARLEDAGLVERGKDGTLILLEQVFAMAARVARRPGRPSRRPARAGSNVPSLPRSTRPASSRRASALPAGPAPRPGQRLDRLGVHGAEDQRGGPPTPVLVGQQADELRRRRAVAAARLPVGRPDAQ